MIKGLVSIVLGLFFLNANSQENFNYYKVYELNISDLNVLPSNENYDFGYNYSVDPTKSIELGYYLWIQSTWYKVLNDKEVFLVENKSPLYFKIDKSLTKELQIKDSVGAVYSYNVDLLESYLVSELIYKTNLDVIKNIAEAESTPVNKISVEDVVSVSSVVFDEKLNNKDLKAKDEPVISDKDLLDEINAINVANANAMLFMVEPVSNSVDEVESSELVEIEPKVAVSESNDLKMEITNSKLDFFIVPNIELPISARKGRVLTFDLFDYYEKYFENVVVSSSSNPTKIKLNKLDLEYQVTSFNPDEIEIIEISNQGVLKYKILKSDANKNSNVNIRFVLL